MTVEPLALRPSDAAKQLSVSKRHIYRMIETGEIKAGRLGKRYLVPVAEIDRILEAR